jgi:hypothetical protein
VYGLKNRDVILGPGVLPGPDMYAHRECLVIPRQMRYDRDMRGQKSKIYVHQPGKLIRKDIYTRKRGGMPVESSSHIRHPQPSAPGSYGTACTL